MSLVDALDKCLQAAKWSKKLDSSLSFKNVGGLSFEFNDSELISLWMFVYGLGDFLCFDIGEVYSELKIQQMSNMSQSHTYITFKLIF